MRSSAGRWQEVDAVLGGDGNRALDVGRAGGDVWHPSRTAKFSEVALVDATGAQQDDKAPRLWPNVGEGVRRAARHENGTWEVELENGETHLYDCVLVANGHHWDPR